MMFSEFIWLELGSLAQRTQEGSIVRESTGTRLRIVSTLQKREKQPSRVHIQVCSELCVGLPLNLIAALARVVVLFAEQARDLRNGREGAGYRVFKTAPKLPICPSN